MTKYRIVRVTPDCTNSEALSKSFYIIERKRLFWWFEIYNKEDVICNHIKHKTEEDAESYLIKKYAGDGELKRYGNVYTYSQYSYGGY
jgi:hypothetical protein